MHTRELDTTKIDDAINKLEAVALQRLNETFSPIIIQAQKQLADVGVSFNGPSHTTHTVGMGAKSFFVDEDYRVGLVVVDFVSVRPTGLSDVAMICSVLNYERSTGELLLEPQEGYVTGSGTYSDWQIKVSVTPNLDTYSREDVNALIDGLVDNAPPHLNTLKELAEAIVGGTVPALAMQRTNNLSDLLNPTQARANIGLGNVNNTADASKPVSAPQQAAINAVVAAVLPVGTSLLFFQATVPPGWIRNTSHNDKTIRVVSTTGGGAGGVQAWSSVFGRTTVDYTTLDTNTLPVHAHGLYDPGHAHGVADYTHVHGIGDPGHAHGVYDPSHQHAFVRSDISEWKYGYPYYDQTVGNMYQYWTGTDWRGTGIGIYGAGHGSWLDYRYANIAIYGAGTGMGVYNAGASWGHTHGLDLRCQYIDVIIGVKS
ncbi:MAG TPA: hypothetical protein VIZ32_16590 [Vicinamibacterales bacterium]